MKKNIFGLIFGTILFAVLTAGCSGSFGFDGKGSVGLGTETGGGGTGSGGGTGTDDNSKDNPFKDTAWENSENGITLAFDSDTCEITVGTAKTASIAREATAGQVNAGTYSYTWKLNDDGSFTATLKYTSGDVYATFTITASASSGKLMIDTTEFTFNKKNGGGTGTGDGTETGDETEIWDIKGNVLVKYTGSKPTVIIPNEVKSIGDNAFKDCTSLVNVTIPRSVESIGKKAFSTNLGSVSYEGNEDDWRHILLYIDEEYDTTGSNIGKEDGTGLRYKTISSTVGGTRWAANGTQSYWKAKTSSEWTVGMQIETYRGKNNSSGISIPFGATDINDNAFKETGIHFASIPNTVKSIGNRAFYGAYFSEGFCIPDGVTSIGEAAFEECYFLDGSIIIPDSVTSIGDDAFYKCTLLKSVELSKGMTSIGERVFFSCSALSSVIIPDGVTSIGKEAFFNCGSLKEINIPDSITTIGQGAFSGCGSIKAVKIPDGVTRIEGDTFSFCYLLDDVTIPVSVRYIGRNAFPNKSLRTKNVKYEGTEADWKKIEFGTEKGTSELIGLEDCVIHGKDKDGNDVEWKCKQHNY